MRRLSLGQLIPAALVLLAAVELAHYIRPGIFPLDPIVLAVVNAPPHAPFARDYEVALNHLHGDLTDEKTQRLARAYPLVFSTDDAGYRRTPGTGKQQAEVLTVRGGSFLWGATLSDDETLTARLASRLGLSVYNAGRYSGDDDGIDELLRLTSSMPHLRRVVIVILERFDLSPVPPPPPGLVTKVWRVLHLRDETRLRLRDHYNDLSRNLEKRKLTSPLLRVGQKAEIVLGRAGFVHGAAIDKRRMFFTDGSSFIVRTDEIDRLLRAPSPQATEDKADAVLQIVNALQNRYDVCVAVVPDKLSVYAPFLKDAEDLAIRATSSSNDLQRALERRGLRTVNLLGPLRHAAETGVLQYYRDDTHWTPAGVATAADAIGEAIGRAKATTNAVQ